MTPLSRYSPGVHAGEGGHQRLSVRESDSPAVRGRERCGDEGRNQANKVSVEPTLTALPRPVPMLVHFSSDPTSWELVIAGHPNSLVDVLSGDAIHDCNDTFCGSLDLWTG